MKYVNSVREHFSKQAVFTVRDLLIFLDATNVSRPYAHVLLHNLLKKGELVRISRGIYSFKKDPAHWGFAFSPFYYGLQESLSLRNLWEQESIPVIITPRRVKTGIRVINGANIWIRRIQRKAFFGFEMLPYYDFHIPVSDVEKTLIDFIYFKEPLPENVLRALLDCTRREKLEAYLKFYPERFRKRFEAVARKAGKKRTWL